MSTPTHPHLPPATPTYILRGHSAAIHALQIFASNLRLISGDADGWIIVWDLIFKRPVAAWKAHEGAVLEVKGFSLGDGKVTEVYTHGRDHKLKVWRFRVQDEEVLQKTLPVDAAQAAGESQSQIKPWLVHFLHVNALNFCAFSLLVLAPSEDSEEAKNEDRDNSDVPPSSALIAVPNALDSGAIDLFHLPSERRVCTIPTDPTVNTGMVMAAQLVRNPESKDLSVAAAFEDGHVRVSVCRGVFQNSKPLVDTSRSWKWEQLYISKPHSQPVLSIDLIPSRECFFSSSADAVLGKHPIPTSASERVVPLKVVNTKYAGQQGIRVRSDGKIFATAGWDSRVRVYSCKSMKELAVLKWHKEGCYAVAFADVVPTVTTTPFESLTPDSEHLVISDQTVNNQQGVIVKDREYSLAQVQRQRSLKVQNTHWLVAGSKDGKISLWDIY